MNVLVEYCLFIGLVLYLATSAVFLMLFLRAMKTVDGVGLMFLKILTLGITIGSFVVFLTRLLSEYGEMDVMTSRAIAVINPITLLGVGLYLNYLFRRKTKPFIKTDTQNIDTIKKDVKEVKADVKLVKKEVVK